MVCTRIRRVLDRIDGTTLLYDQPYKIVPHTGFEIISETGFAWRNHWQFTVQCLFVVMKILYKNQRLFILQIFTFRCSTIVLYKT